MFPKAILLETFVVILFTVSCKPSVLQKDQVSKVYDILGILSRRIVDRSHFITLYGSPRQKLPIFPKNK